jgi:hypothetical protein
MAVTRVRSIKVVTWSAGATSVGFTSLPANIPVGDDIVMWVSMDPTNAGTLAFADNSTQTGSVNTYTVQLDAGNTGFVRLVGITCHVSRQVQTTDTITMTISGSTSIEGVLRAVQYTGSPVGFNAASTTATGSTATITSPSVTTTAASGILIGAVAVSSGGLTITVGTLGGGTATVSGSTSLEGRSVSSGGAEVGDEDRPFTTQGTAHATFGTTSGLQWAAGVIALVGAFPDTWPIGYQHPQQMRWAYY